LTGERLSYNPTDPDGSGQIERIGVCINVHALWEEPVDNELINRILGGEVDRFDDLMNRHYKEILVFVLRQLHDVETSKNVTQEIWMRVYAKLRLFSPRKATFRTWLYHVAANVVKNHVRSNLRNLETVALDIETASFEDVERAALKQEEVNHILLQMQRHLSPRDYKLMMMHFFAGLSNQELAEQFQIDEKTVRNTLSKCIQRIKTKVGETHAQ
jgi:RNA polymerase sigma-70 factor (ECF subfamily)